MYLEGCNNVWPGMDLDHLYYIAESYASSSVDVCTFTSSAPS